ncbi:MAG: hypothetical protein ACOC2L_05415, partial [Candidatus Sumerlaeota bacterium]
MGDRNSKKPRKRKLLRSRWRKWRPLRRVILIVAVLSIPLTALFFIPFSSNFFNDRLKQAWLEATGLELEFDKSVFHLVSRNFEITGVRFINPENGRVLYSLEDVEVIWNWRFARVPIEVQTVILNKPGDAVLEMDPHYHFAPTEELGNFIGVLSHLTDENADAEMSDFPMPNIRVRNAGLFLRAARGEGARETLAGIESMDLRFDMQSGMWRLNLRGTLTGESLRKDDALISLEFVPTEGRAGSYRFALRVERIGLSPFFETTMDTGPFRLYASGVSIQGHIDIGDKESIAGGFDSISIQSVRVNLPTFNFHIPVSRLAGRGDWSFEYDNSLLAVRDIQLDLLNSSIRGSGEMVFGEKYPFNLQLRDSRLSPLWMNVSQTLASQFLPASAHVLEGELYPEMDVSGDLTGLDWNRSQFQLKGRGLRMRIPEYTQGIVGPVAFEAELTSDTLRVPLLDVEMEKDRLKLQMVQASLLGDSWREGLSIGGQWMLNADLASVMKRVQAHGALPNLELSGKADGDGVIIGKWIPTEKNANGNKTHWALRLRDEIQSLMRHIRVTGEVNVSDGRGFHHLLPAPVRGVSGRIEMAGNTLTASDLKGSMLGSDVLISARLEGDEQFWIEPQMRFDLKGDVELKDTEELLKSEVLEMNWPGPYRRE